MAEDWTKEWERRVVNGVYPLSRYLGRSDHSVVFLTECKAHDIPQAAIKILPAIPALMDAQLGHWKRVATLTHPHLIRLLDAGRCQLGGHHFLFVVTDYAEQNLAQVLSGRPLTAEEVRELLPPTLDALAYLHAKNLVQGSLKPPNFLVVGDQLKLASDTIRPAGERPASTAKPSLYDAPEAKKGRMSTAGDLWGLGITLVETLTQTPPPWSRESTDSVTLPPDLAPEFVGPLQRCLDRDPGRRPTAAELAAQFSSASPITAVPVTPAALHEPLVRTLSTQSSPNTRLLVTVVAAGIVGLWLIWLIVHLFQTHTDPQPSTAAAPPPPPAVASPATAQNPGPSSGAPLATVVHQEIPDISRRARESIHGVITLAVRVDVDRAGNVIAATLETRASSRYFAHAAQQAAKKWRFAPTTDQASRAWLLHFEFSRTGTAAHAAVVR